MSNFSEPSSSSKMLPSVAYLSVRHVLRHCLFLLLVLSLLLTNFPLPEWQSRDGNHLSHLVHSTHRHATSTSIVAEAKALKKLKKLFKMKKKLSKFLPFLLMGPKIIIIQKNSGGNDYPSYGSSSYGYGGGGGSSMGYYSSGSSMMDESNSYSST